MPKLLLLKLAHFQQIYLKETNMHFTKILHILQSPVLVIEDGRSCKKVFCAVFFEGEYNIIKI